MTENAGVWVGHNEGIVSTGDHAVNTVSILRLAAGSLASPADVPAPAGVVRLRFGAQPTLFVGRDREVAALGAALSGGPGVITQALTGLGGIGKSTLAEHYALANQESYNPIWWITAEDGGQIDAGIAALARRLYPVLAALPEAVAVQWGIGWLSGHRGWLVVLDNVTRPSDVAALVASLSGGTFLITSRHTAGWSGIARPLRLDVFEPGESVRLLAQIAGPVLAEGAAELAAALGHLPLAVRQAAAYLEQNHVTATTYLDRLTTVGDVLAWTPDGGDPGATTAVVWHESLERITAERGPLPGLILRAAAWLAPGDIPLDVVRALVPADEAAIEQALGSLAGYALIGRSGDRLWIHRLVQAVNRDVPPEAAARARTHAARALLTALPDPFDPDGWTIWRERVPHVEALLDHTDPDGDTFDSTELADQLGRYKRDNGDTTGAVSLHSRALESRTRLQGPEHPSTLMAQHQLGISLLHAGEVQRAIEMHELTLETRTRVLGASAYDTLRSRLNLASAYARALQFSHAVDLLEATFHESYNEFGKLDPLTVTAKENLAGQYLNAKNPEMSAFLLRQVVEDRSRIQGPLHRDTLRAMNALGTALHYSGESAQAVPILRDALTGARQTLSAHHPMTGDIEDNLRRVEEWERRHSE